MKYFAPTKLSENIRETPEGFLVCLDVPIARTGWQDYGKGETPLEVGNDGKVNIHRHSDDVFHPETIASYEGKPLTIGHPNEFVDPDNWKHLAKGVIQNVRKSDKKDDDGEESLLADILVTDSIAIGLIKNGLREVSCGYEAMYEQTGEGKARQHTIIGNHLALVDQGRAGPSYAINDHKTKRLNAMSKLTEQLKTWFSQTVDEAAEAVGKKEDDKVKDDAGKVEKKADGSTSYDELAKMVKDLGSKIESMGKPKDEAPMDKQEKKEDKSADADVAASLEDRIKAIEVAIAKLMENKSEDSDKESEGSDDDYSEEEEPGMTGDTASRAEILSPGIRLTKDVKVKALKAAYGTKDGKMVIESLTGGKAPSLSSADQVSTLFIAASAVLKASRGTGLEGTKNSKSFDSAPSTTEHVSAEKMNELNRAHYGLK